MAQTEAQKKAQKKYREKNKEKTRYTRYKTTARTFIRHHATKEDLQELIDIYNNRETQK